MKKLVVIGLIFFTAHLQAQVLVNLQLPSSGVVQKTQLWNMVVTNTTGSAFFIHIELMLSDAGTGQQVMSAVTKTLLIPSGTTQLNASILNPILYNIVNSAYPINPGPSGLLPIGNFEVCYSFMRHISDVIDKVAEQCDELVIEPLSPPQLIYPYDQTAIRELNPQFSWIPPAPSSLFINLSYDFKLAEISPGQTAATAIQQNYPVLQEQNINTTSLLYPQTAPTLELNKHYAWRIVARSNQSPVSQSEVWEFTIKQFQQADSLIKGDLPYAKLRKDDQPGYAIFANDLKFDYLNETIDSVWNIAVYDLSLPQRKKVILNLDSVILKRGQNQVLYSVRNNPDFIDKHIYILEVKNSRNEIWKLRFEFRKPPED